MLETDRFKIGQKIKEYRKRQKLTQFELAEKVDLNEKQISRIEAGLNYPTYLSFAKLVDALGINLNEFSFGQPAELSPLEKDITYLIKESTESEQKMFFNILKIIKENKITNY